MSSTRCHYFVIVSRGGVYENNVIRHTFEALQIQNTWRYGHCAEVELLLLDHFQGAFAWHLAQFFARRTKERGYRGRAN